MTLLQTILMSVVEGLTEFLPVSSTAHLVLTSQILNVAQSDFVKSFEIIIQLGAILAVVVLYYKELEGNTKLWFRTILAFLPSVVIGLFLYDFIKERLIGNGLITATALIIGGLAFIIADRLVTKTILATSPSPPRINNIRLFPPNFSEEHNFKASSIDTISPVKLLLIGLFQCLAMIPGVSRSAASIFGGLLVGLNKAEATKFSFFLAIPTMLAATSLDLYKSQLNFSQHELLLLSLGFIGSFVTAFFAIRSFIKFVQIHSFLPFGIYRILVGIFWLFAILRI